MQWQQEKALLKVLYQATFEKNELEEIKPLLELLETLLRKEAVKNQPHLVYALNFYAASKIKLQYGSCGMQPERHCKMH